MTLTIELIKLLYIFGVVVAERWMALFRYRTSVD